MTVLHNQLLETRRIMLLQKLKLSFCCVSEIGTQAMKMR